MERSWRGCRSWGRHEEAAEAKSPKSRSKKKANEETPKVRDGDVAARVGGRVVITGTDRISIVYEERVEREYAVPAAARPCIENGDVVRAGQQLTEGSPDLRDVLRFRGEDGLLSYVVGEIQRVYRSQGVTINDKHIEVIVRQMLRKVRVKVPGDTLLSPNDIVDRSDLAAINAAVVAQGGDPATSAQLLLGVTAATLSGSGFLAAAAFQETTQVLTEAAFGGQTDHLVGLNEHVIIGKLIPARATIDLPKRPLEGESPERSASLPSAAPSDQLPSDLPTADDEADDGSASEEGEDEDRGETFLEPSAQQLQAIERGDPFDDA